MMIMMIKDTQWPPDRVSALEDDASKECRSTSIQLQPLFLIFHLSTPRPVILIIILQTRLQTHVCKFISYYSESIFKIFKQTHTVGWPVCSGVLCEDRARRSNTRKPPTDHQRLSETPNPAVDNLIEIETNKCNADEQLLIKPERSLRMFEWKITVKNHMIYTLFTDNSKILSSEKE